MRPIYETVRLDPRVARSSSIPVPGAAATVARLDRLCLGLHHSLLGNEPGGEIAPQGHNQLARQSNDGDAPGALAGIGRAGPEPLAQRAVRLMAEPEPGQFDRLLACQPIACLADALLPRDATAPPGTRARCF
jgi:hypothetical protein